MNSAVGLIGSGVLGRVLGGRLLDAGFPLYVVDPDPSAVQPLVARGGRRVESLARLAELTTFFVDAVPGPDELEVVLRPLWAAVRPKSVHVTCSTVGPHLFARLQGIAREGGIRWIDAPIAVGSEGTLSGWTAGHVDHIDLASELLAALVDRTVYCGALGAGQSTKLVNNLIALTTVAVVGEALALGVGAGLDLDTLRRALHEGSAQSRVLDEQLPLSAFREAWEPGLRSRLAAKDFSLAVDLGRQLEIELEVSAVARSKFTELASKSPDDSAHGVVREIARAAGVSLRSPLESGRDGGETLG